jgi:hypothetical protein
VWSKRLNRGIQWKYGLFDSAYVSVQYRGVRHVRGIAEAVVQSWLSDSERESLVTSVPETSLGDIAALRNQQGAIALIAATLRISESIAFSYLLSRTRSSLT